MRQCYIISQLFKLSVSRDERKLNNVEKKQQFKASDTLNDIYLPTILTADFYQ